MRLVVGVPLVDGAAKSNECFAHILQHEHRRRRIPMLDSRLRAAHTLPMTSPDPYTPPSYRGAILMVVVIVLALAFLWLAFSNALDSDFGRNVDIPGVPRATILDQPVP